MLLEKIQELLIKVKKEKPLVHHITNYVTVNDCANIVLALGGSPVMADDIREVEEMTSLSKALVLNIGTLNQRTIESMLASGKKANELGIPVVLDPVGAGATTFRTNTAQKIIKEVQISIIRGNMSEIKTIAGRDAKTKGVDSQDLLDGGDILALNLAKRLDCVIAITGEKDIISDGQRLCIIENGHKMLSNVTGTGCMCTSLIGAYAGSSKDYYLSAIAGVLTMGLAGEKSFEGLCFLQGIGTFRTRLFDYVSNLSSKDIMEGAKVCERKA